MTLVPDAIGAMRGNQRAMAAASGTTSSPSPARPHPRPTAPRTAPMTATPPMAAKLKPMLNQPMARARRSAGKRSPTDAMRLVGASEPSSPARKRTTASAAKLGASAAPALSTATLRKAITIIGLRPSRSDSKPENGENSACGTPAAAASKPAWPSEISRSREMSTSSGPIIRTDVTIPVTPAVISTMGSGLTFIHPAHSKSSRSMETKNPPSDRAGDPALDLAGGALLVGGEIGRAGQGSHERIGRVQRPVAHRGHLALILDRVGLLPAIDQARPELRDHDAVVADRHIPPGLERP